MRILFAGLWALLLTLCPGQASARERAPASLSQMISAEAKARDFSGTILVERKGRTAFKRSFGLADRSFSVVARTDDRYRIASITKLFTSTIVMMLKDEGKLSLGSTVAELLPSYPGEDARRITIRTLLNHTSGIAQYDRIASLDQALHEGIPQYQLPQSADALLKRCCSGPLVHDPGATFDYNNADYIVLGRIVERIEGRPFADVLQRRILRPLGLSGTGIADQAQIIPRLTPTYFWLGEGKGWMNDIPAYYQNWDAAGGMYSTADDLAKFSEALFDGRLLGTASLKEMLHPGLDDYGFGLWSYTFTRRGRAWSVAKRPGSIMGANAQLYRLLDKQTTIILLANTNRADLDQMVQAIGAWIASR